MATVGGKKHQRNHVNGASPSGCTVNGVVDERSGSTKPQRAKGDDENDNGK